MIFLFSICLFEFFPPVSSMLREFYKVGRVFLELWRFKVMDHTGIDAPYVRRMPRARPSENSALTKSDSFGKAESMRDGSTPEEDGIRLWVDRGYQGTDKDLPRAKLMIPHRRTKNHRILTAEQKGHSRRVNSTRVRVEHSIGRHKRYARLADPYYGTISQFNYEFNVIMTCPCFGKVTRPVVIGTSIDWNGAVPPASDAPF